MKIETVSCSASQAATSINSVSKQWQNYTSTEELLFDCSKEDVPYDEVPEVSVEKIEETLKWFNMTNKQIEATHS